MLKNIKEFGGLENFAILNIILQSSIRTKENGEKAVSRPLPVSLHHIEILARYMKPAFNELLRVMPALPTPYKFQLGSAYREKMI